MEEKKVPVFVVSMNPRDQFDWMGLETTEDEFSNPMVRLTNDQFEAFKHVNNLHECSTFADGGVEIRYLQVGNRVKGQFWAGEEAYKQWREDTKEWW